MKVEITDEGADNIVIASMKLIISLESGTYWSKDEVEEHQRDVEAARTILAYFGGKE